MTIADTIRDTIMVYEAPEGARLTIQADSVCAAPAHSAEQMPHYLTMDWWNRMCEEASNTVNLSYSFDDGFLVVMLILGLLGIASFVVFLWMLWKRKAIPNLAFPFVFIWLYGVVVYDIGMFTGDPVSLIGNLPMAILYGFKIFLLDSDVSELHEVFHESWLFSANFALVHFLAAILSMLFVIKHFGYNILSAIKLWLVSYFGREREDTYVIWGFNEASCHLAESINDHYGELGCGKASQSYRIVVVRTTSNDDDSAEARTAINRIFNFLSLKDAELGKLISLKCLTTSTFVNIEKVDSDNIRSKEKNDKTKGKQYILRNVFGLNLLSRIIQKTSRNVHFIFMSDKERDNLYAVNLLVNDRTVNDFAEGGDGNRRVIFYCHARNNSVHRVIEDVHESGKIRVKVVDSSHIGVEMLKEKDNGALLPVNFVDVEADGTVSSAFHALVVGFSEVGLDATRFLYEFGAFVRTGSTDDKAVRSEFHLDVVDRDMDALAGSFVANAPAIHPSMPFLKGCGDDKSLITLHKMDCRSAEFYLHLEKWIRTLQYIVIATDNDELNMTLAVRIFKAAARYRDTGSDDVRGSNTAKQSIMDRLCILVRIHNDSDGHFRTIINHYNRLWKAFTVSENGGKQDKVGCDEEVKGPIYVFGLDIKTYTFENVVDDRLEKKAREYKEIYDKSVPLTPEERDARKKYGEIGLTTWDKEEIDSLNMTEKENIPESVRGMARYENKYSPTYYGIMCLRRKQGQNFANCLHEVTKRLLMDKALEKNGLTFEELQGITREQDSLAYRPAEEMDNEVFEKFRRIAIVLAQTEHLRWNASHEILGYVPSKEKDEVRLRHNYLRDWEHLSEEKPEEKEKVRAYDSNVADVVLHVEILPKNL